MSTNNIPKVLFTDGEGPLIFKDLARDVSARFNEGQFLFDTISLYNAFLAESRGPNQHGDTLALLVLHLLAHGISDEDLRDEARSTILATGVQSYLRLLRENDWQIRVFSTAYRHTWEVSGPILGINLDHIAASDVSLEGLKSKFWGAMFQEAIFCAEETILLRKAEILAAQKAFRDGASIEDLFCELEAMRQVCATLDHLYLKTLPDLGFEPLNDVPVMNGARKVESAITFCRQMGVEPHSLVYVGDSITDDRINVFIRDLGGLPIAVNSDHYGLRNAVVAVATEDMSALVPILETWTEGGLRGVRAFIESGRSHSVGKERMSSLEQEVPTRYDFVALASEQEILRIAQVHKETRSRIRRTPPPIL